GNQLFNLKRYEDARMIFENNTAEFSNRDLVWVSLGKTYEAMQRKTDAIASYQKAVSLNSNNEEAKNRLKELQPGKASQ
ncbi:MAG: tetratricopeptide repeat protein, partial [Chitinophagaceae bacterium]